jgi:ParB family chromosome partitioning protein
MTKSISDIRVGDNRHRRELGDIAGLAESIRTIGLLHPITVDAEGNLLAGARRLAACKQLGLTHSTCGW